MNLPNLISMTRLLMVPLIVWLIAIGQWKAAFVLFCAAGLSDALDGLIAKRFNAQTRLGRYLDPIADKSLLIAIFITLGVKGALPVWLVILVVSRDILIVGGVMLLYALDQLFEPRPLLASKFNTVAQIALAALVMADLGFAIPRPDWLLTALTLLTAATVVISGAAYLIDWGRRMNAMERSDG